MTGPATAYQTTTVVALFQPPTPTGDVQVILESLATYYDGRRDGLLRELAAVEKEMGLGTKEKPTTAQIRDWWRKRARKCPRCGVEL